jgi:hypothetical protein
MSEILAIREQIHDIAENEYLMPALSIEEAIVRFNMLVEFVKTVMRKDIDFGVIPGTVKPTLLKPGAEKLCTLFGLTSRFQLLEKVEDWIGRDHNGEPFFYYLYRCQLFRNGMLITEADGSCNSFEQKYRWRKAERKCPVCSSNTIIKGKEEYGGGWLCLLPDTPVLYADFTWRPIGEAQRGDVIFGFDEYPTQQKFGRKLRPTVIEDVWFNRQQTKRLITADSEIITTSHHKWLQHHNPNGHLGHWDDPWETTDKLRVGNYLRHIGIHNPLPVTDDYRAGYLSGITLGDGTMRYAPGEANDRRKPFYWRVALKASDEAALGRIVAYLASFGVEAYVRPFDSGIKYDGIPYPMKKVDIRSLGRLQAIHDIMQTRETLEFQRGFVAGFFDAEGSGHEAHLRVYQKDASVLELIRRYTANLGFTFDVQGRDDSRSSARLCGGILERFRFFATCQPALVRKAGMYGTTMMYNPSKILAVESGPMMDVVDIQTSTGTFFASGIATHNCFAKKGGCGAKFRSGDPAIESQQAGRAPNQDIYDQVNTIQKIAQKRSLIGATLLGVNASEFFTQDIEDMAIGSEWKKNQAEDAKHSLYVKTVMNPRSENHIPAQENDLPRQRLMDRISRLRRYESKLTGDACADNSDLSSLNPIKLRLICTEIEVRIREMLTNMIFDLHAELTILEPQAQKVPNLEQLSISQLDNIYRAMEAHLKELRERAIRQ